MWGLGGEYFTFNFNLNQVHTFTYIRGTVQKICGQKPNFGHIAFWTASLGDIVWNIHICPIVFLAKAQYVRVINAFLQYLYCTHAPPVST